MPAVLLIGPYRFFFYAGDHDEPRHIHIERDEKIVKFWLEPAILQQSGGFNRTEPGRIHKIIEEHRTLLLEAWNEYVGG